MERLRNSEAAPGSKEALARELLAASRPYAVPASWKARGRHRLEREPARRRPALRWLRLHPVAAAGLSVLVLGGAVAAATSSVPWFARRLGLDTHALQLAPRALPPAAPVRAGPPPAAPLAVFEPNSVGENPPARPIRKRAGEDAPRVRPSGKSVAAPSETARVAPQVVPARAPDVATSSDDPALVAQAIRALREESDSARAGRLLQTYLERHPEGALVEDVLALAIEAAAGGPPEPRRALARRYLARFPAGRYRALAREALK